MPSLLRLSERAFALVSPLLFSQLVLVALVWRRLMLRRKVLQICCSALLGEGLSGIESPVGERAIMLDVHFISSSSVELSPACRGTGDIKHVQKSGAVD